MQRSLGIFYVLFEVLAIYIFVNEYGFLNLFLEIIISGIVGFIVLFKFGFINMANLSSPMQMISNFGISIGGFLLMLPGVVCDIIGVCVIMFSAFAKKDVSTNKSFKQDNTQEDIIDVEVIDEDKK